MLAAGTGEQPVEAPAVPADGAELGGAGPGGDELAAVGCRTIVPAPNLDWEVEWRRERRGGEW
ncbi:MAG: hypothetical protein AAFZ09_02090, partial [Pseudomonadota bacterium]